MYSDNYIICNNNTTVNSLFLHLIIKLEDNYRQHSDSTILLVRPLGIKFIEILIESHAFSFIKMRLNVGHCVSPCMFVDMVYTISENMGYF